MTSPGPDVACHATSVRANSVVVETALIWGSLLALKQGWADLSKEITK